MARLFPVGFPKKNILVDNDVATSPVTPTTANCVIGSIRISNPTAGAITFSLEDNSGTPNDWYEAVSIPANSILNEQFPEGKELKCTAGFDYVASGAGLDLNVIYWTGP